MERDHDVRTLQRGDRELRTAQAMAGRAMLDSKAAIDADGGARQPQIKGSRIEDGHDLPGARTGTTSKRAGPRHGDKCLPGIWIFGLAQFGPKVGKLESPQTRTPEQHPTLDTHKGFYYYINCTSI